MNPEKHKETITSSFEEAKNNIQTILEKGTIETGINIEEVIGKVRSLTQEEIKELIDLVDNFKDPSSDVSELSQELEKLLEDDGVEDGF